MGYQRSTEDDRPPVPIELRSVSKKDFELTTRFAYKPKIGATILVPPHPNALARSTDLASVPPLLWGLLPSYGRQLRAALLHDRLCDEVNQKLREGAPSRQVYALRLRADHLFFEGMRDSSAGGDQKRVGLFRARLFWVGVSYGRYWKLRKARAFLMTLQVLAGVLAIDLWWNLPPLPWLGDFLPWAWATDNGVLVSIWLTAAAASVFWWRDVQIPLLGLFVGPFVLPVLLVTLLAQLCLGLPDQFLHLLGSSQPPANFGPTVAAARSGIRQVDS